MVGKKIRFRSAFTVISEQTFHPVQLRLAFLRLVID
jgi:hypothetical protein